jgi:hypothetical protein
MSVTRITEWSKKFLKKQSVKSSQKGIDPLLPTHEISTADYYTLALGLAVGDDYDDNLPFTALSYSNGPAFDFFNVVSDDKSQGR